MSVLLGSARTSSYNLADQVSVQDYYTHKQGYWLGFEPKSHALDLANAMKELCANNKIGYSQDYRETAWNMFEYFGRSIANINKRCYTDCSAGVRLCIWQAFNKQLPNFNTESEPSVLKKSGLFKEPIKVTNASQCTTGMVLCSPNKGHTVIVISTGKENNKTKYGVEVPPSSPLLRRGSKGKSVRLLQSCLNIVNKDCNLEVDGDFGPKTETELKKFQKKNKLEVDGVYGPRTHDKLKIKMN